MERGQLNLNAGGFNENIFVVDAELLFEIKTKWFRKRWMFNALSEKVIAYVEKRKGAFDRVVIPTIKNGSFVEYVLNKILFINDYEVIDFIDEENYSAWMRIVKPALHFTTVKRRYYYKTSVYITEEYLIKINTENNSEY